MAITTDDVRHYRNVDPVLYRRMRNSEDPKMKKVILDFDTEENAKFASILESYKNNSFVFGNENVPLSKVAQVVLLKTYRTPNKNAKPADVAKYNEHKAKFPKLYAAKAEAWDILHNLQEALEANDKVFSLATDDLRGIVEAAL